MDDDQDITILFRDALNNIPNISACSFTDPMSALEHFEKNYEEYALVISDLRMPGLNGLQFLRKIKDANRFTRTILMTAFDVNDKMFGQFVKKKIIDAFIQKPIKIHELLIAVESQLHSYEVQKRYPIQER